MADLGHFVLPISKYNVQWVRDNESSSHQLLQPGVMKATSKFCDVVLRPELTAFRAIMHCCLGHGTACGEEG